MHTLGSTCININSILHARRCIFLFEAYVNYVTRVASPELNYSSGRMEEWTFYVGISDAAIMHPNAGSVGGRAK